MTRTRIEADVTTPEFKTALTNYTRLAYAIKRSLTTLKRLYWFAVPALAVIAYLTVLRVGFLLDDLTLLFQAHQEGLRWETLLPNPSWFMYRPIVTLLLWQVGFELWGYNPLPYHIVGLLAHAATSLVLALWAVEATRRRWLGWLAGALFAVFPIHAETVGWLAAQWDVWATLFALLSLLTLTRWWRQDSPRQASPRLYLLSFLFYTLSVFTKESALTWLPVLAMSIWLLSIPFTRKDAHRLARALLPFSIPLAANVALRIATWGSLGGYSTATTDLGTSLWDKLDAYVRSLISPVNVLLLGPATQQVVGVVVTSLLLLGLAWHGKRNARLLTFAGAWVVLTIVPVLNLPTVGSDLHQSRFLYLATGGYCLGVATILCELVASTRRARPALVTSVALMILLCISTCWIYLRPWHTATVQVQDIGQELHKMIPAQVRPGGMLWYIQNSPDTYKGAYVLGLGMNGLRFFTDGDGVQVVHTKDATSVNVAEDPQDVFALKFYYSQSADRFPVSYASGVTSNPGPPSGESLTAGGTVWDFTRCSASTLAQWQVIGAQSHCEPGEGLLLQPSSGDSRLLGPPVSLNAENVAGAFVRLRAGVSYPANTDIHTTNQWFWQTPGNSWNEEQSRNMAISSNGKSHIYWTFLSSSDVRQHVSKLRFDPVNGSVSCTVSWLAADVVK